MEKILLIAHYFPPIGGAGVQRAAKFVKYLPSFGFSPLVLTGAITTGNRWTPEDDSLLAEIPPSVKVFRVSNEGRNTSRGINKSGRARERIKASVEEGSRIINEHRPKLILVTMSPFDDAFVAAELSKQHGIPWVADLRDPWALDEFQVHRTAWHRWRERRLMAESLATASSIIMNTPQALTAFRETFPALASKAVISITNGFDPDDFSGTPEVMFPRKFNLVHSGYFHADMGLRQESRLWEYRLLGRTSAGVRLLPRSHFYLLRAIERWLSTSPEVAEKIVVICLGKASEADQQIVEDSSCNGIFTFAGYTPHAECMRYVLGADLLFLPMHSLPNGGRATIVPGKTYEYMASGRPILAAVPEGDARDFLQQAGTASLCAPDDIDQMVTILRAQFSRWLEGQAAPPRKGEYLGRFERRNLTKSLSNELSRVLRLAS